MLLVLALDAPDYLHSKRRRRLVHNNRLEATFQRGVLFDVLGVFAQCRCAHNGQIAARKRRFQYFGGVHGSVGSTACADKIVNFVHKQNYVTVGNNLRNYFFQTFLEIAAETAACNHTCDVQFHKTFALKFRRYTPLRHGKSQSLYYGCFTNARFAHKHGIVFGAASKRLYNTGEFRISAYYGVDLSQHRAFGKVCTEWQAVVFRACNGVAAHGKFVLGHLRGKVVAAGKTHKRGFVRQCVYDFAEKRVDCNACLFVAVILYFFVSVCFLDTEQRQQHVYTGCFSVAQFLGEACRNPVEAVNLVGIVHACAARIGVVRRRAHVCGIHADFQQKMACFVFHRNKPYKHVMRIYFAAMMNADVCLSIGKYIR